MGRARQGVLGLIAESRVPARPAIWIPVALAVLIQSALFLSFQPVFTIDSAQYVAQAESIATTGAARNAQGEPDTVRTPGYPLFLAAFLLTPFGFAGAVVAQRILWIVVVGVTAWLCARLTRSTIAGLAAGLVTAIDLPALQATNSILTETVAAVLVGAAVWQSYRAGRSNAASLAVAAGVLAGASALIRPIAFLFAVPLGLAMVFAGDGKHRGRAAVMLLVASLLVTSAWVVRNYMQTGVATLSSIGSINLLRYRAAGILAIRDAGGIDANLERRQAELEADACRAVEMRFGRDCLSVPIATRATFYDDVALPIIFADLPAAAMQAGRGFVMILFGSGANMLSGTTGVSESAARTIALVYTVPLAVLALIGLPYWWRTDRLAAALLTLTVIYFLTMSLGAEAYSRFRVPFLPLYAMLAGGGAAALARRAGFTAPDEQPSQ